MNSKLETQSRKLGTWNLELGTSKAFTLIELLVVISIIGVLAGLLFVAMPGVNKAKTIATAKAELTGITTAIEDFKAAYGTYPQDNRPTNGAATPNPLYYELTGVQIVGNGTQFKPLDGSPITNKSTVIGAFVNISGLVNSSDSVLATDDRPAITSFLKDLKPDRIGTTNGARILVFSGDGTPWRYNSSSPTNNPNSYDLWADLVIGDKTNRISNWAK